MEPLESKNKAYINEHCFFEIIEEIGKGSSCIAYKGYYVGSFSDGEENKRLAILKEFYPENYRNYLKREFNDEGCFVGLNIDPQYSEELQLLFDSFKNMINLLYSIRGSSVELSSHFVEIIDKVVISNDNLIKGFYITEFCNSFSLEHYLSQNSLEENLEFFKILIRVVDIYHQNGLIIPDLKPSNIAFVKNETKTELKLFDLDSAILLSDIKENFEISVSSPYSAPEYYKGEDISFKSDMYALGMIFFEVIFGADCFDGLNSDNNLVLYDYGFLCYGFEEKLNNIKYYTKNKTKKYTVAEKQQIKYIISKTCIEDAEQRFTTEEFLCEIEILIQIVKNLGVHPAVILKNVIDMAENGEFDIDGFNEDLLSNVKIIKPEQG